MKIKLTNEQVADVLDDLSQAEEGTEMKLKLTNEQVDSVLHDRCLDIHSEDEQTRLALLIFRRSNDIDPVVALRKVVRQVAKQHNMGLSYLLERLK